MQESILVNNIQRFCLHDGPGIRSTIFLMGCSLHCPWCANPENRRFSPAVRFQQQKCVAREGHCFLRSDCPAICGECPTGGFSVADAALCRAGAISVSGKYYTAEALAEEVLRDEFYFRHGGGVTLSGGEPLLHAKALEPFVKTVHEAGINLCIESCLHAPAENLLRILPYIDEWYADLKFADPDMFRSVLNGDFSLYKYNLDTLLASSDSVTLRIPVVPGLTDTEKNLAAMVTLLSELPPAKVEIFSVHNLAESKYKEYGEAFQYFQPAENTYLEELQEMFLKAGKPVSICQL